MDQFLSDRFFLKERLDKGIDIHIPDEDARTFQKLAKQIDKERHFTIYGCQSCINDLVKFVFDNQKTTIRRETFPSAKTKEPAADTKTGSNTDGATDRAEDTKDTSEG